MTQRQDNLRGVSVMMVAVGALALMDAGLKVLSPHYSSMQVATLRALSSLPFVLVALRFRGGYRQLLRVRFPLHLLRGALGIVMLGTFTFALRRLPLAETYSIFFVAPLIIAALAVPILGEKVDRRRWLAIGIGFSGVLIVLRPTGSGTLTLAGLSVLVCATGYSLSSITVRVLSRTDSTESMVFWVMALIAIGAGALALPAWRPIQPEHWKVIAGMGVSGSLGQWAITEAFRHGEASFIAPFEYTALAWGVALDWLLWSTTPQSITFAGAAVIIASGVYLIRHERSHAEAEHP